MGFRRRCFAILAVLALIASPAQAASPSPSPDPSPAFSQTILPGNEVDKRLQKNVDFWIQIYSRYDTSQALVHDAKYIDHIYELIDLPDSDRAQQKLIRATERKWRRVLLSLEKKTRAKSFVATKLSGDELKAYLLFSDVDGKHKFRDAATRKRLRCQVGQRDQFLKGLIESGRYLPAMEETFRKAGLPLELTRLPFVESSFNVHARSKVGASGIWQFMRGTARRYIRVDSAVDERNDPERATEAAVHFLKENYEELGSWPLAVTAYNHGRSGVARAVRKIGSEELGDLVESYKSSSFGFASSNFFAEFLAAVEVERNSQKYFGPIKKAKPLPSFEVRLPDSIRFTDLKRIMHLDTDVVANLNPALTSRTLHGKRRIPAGYRLRLPLPSDSSPEGAAKIFLAGYSEIPRSYKEKYGKSRHR